jgi:arylsulfatase A-like enzyme
VIPGRHLSRLAFVLVPALSLGLASCGGPGGEPPSLLLITVDTLRPDHLGAWGSPRPTSPTVDALAREGVSFATVIAPRGQTWPTLATILSSRYPVEHGVRRNGQSFPADVPTLTAALKERGYACGAFLSNAGQAGWPDFDVLHDLRDHDENVLARAKGWLRARADRPFFLWIHFFGPHRPFRPDAIWRERFDPGYRGPIDGSIEQMREITAAAEDPAPRDLAHMIALYDAEIRELDGRVRELLGALDEVGASGRTLVAFTADHGEELFERNRYFSHSASIYDTVLRLPFVLRWPGRLPAGRLVPGVVPAVDVAPTLLELLGVPAPEEFAGRSQAAAARGEGVPDPDRRAYSELEDLVVSVRTGRWRYVHNPEDHDFPMEGGETGLLYPIAPRELYDHAADPGEKRDVAVRRSDVADSLAREVEAWMARHDWEEASRRHAEREIPEDVREALEAMGYVN